MLDEERVPTTSYRVKHSYEDYYAVASYPKFVGNPPTAVTSGIYRYNVLPQWIVEGMKVLDVAGVPDVNVPDFGRKVGGSYWFEATQDKDDNSVYHVLQDAAHDP